MIDGVMHLMLNHNFPYHTQVELELNAFKPEGKWKYDGRVLIENAPLVSPGNSGTKPGYLSIDYFTITEAIKDLLDAGEFPGLINGACTEYDVVLTPIPMEWGYPYMIKTQDILRS